jgi:hypothetical protein
MKMTTGTARRLLRKVNPAPDNTFADAAQDPSGQATLMAILDGDTSDIIDFGPSHGIDAPASRRRRLPLPARPRWRAAAPAAVLTAALAATLAVVLLVTGNPAPVNQPGAGQIAGGTLVELLANLTAHPSASQDDASAELSRLAAAAAAQPAPAALGPVEYSKAESWGLDLGTTHYGLSYISHQSNLDENWAGSDGASLEVRTWPGGKVPPGNIPVGRSGPSARGAASFARWSDPAKLPTSESLMRQHLIGMSCDIALQCSQNPPSGIVTSAYGLMASEPLPPSARAAILRVLAATAASPGPGRAFYDLGSVSDRAGHQGVAIAYEYGNGTPTQGGAPGSSCTTTKTPGGGTVVACGVSGSASVSASGSSGSPSATPSGSARPSGSTPGSASVSASGSSGSPSAPPSGASPAPSSPSPTPSATSPSPSGSGSTFDPSTFMESSLLVLVFAPSTGALLGVEYAYCNAPVQARLATGKCFATSYDQILEIKAVQSIPATPTASPSTGTP